MKPVTAYVALGANIGDRRANVDAALDRLGQCPGTRVMKVSTFLENPAVGGPPDSPSFLNAVAEVETSLSPRDLLNVLLEIERDLGRVRSEKWAPRVIDLDLLLYGDQVINEGGLNVPHPVMHERRFVLQPLAEIAPNVRHPLLKRTAQELLRSLA